jgi:hypothetical protein
MSGSSGMRRQELFNLLLVVGAALILSVGSILFRLELPVLELPFNLREAQYLLMFLFLGLLPLLAIQARRQEARIAAVFMTITVAVGSLLPPGTGINELILNYLIAATVTLSGVLYFRFAQPSVRPILFAILVILVEFFLYGVGYLGLAVAETQDLRLIIAIVVFTVLVGGFGNIIRKELAGTSGRRLDI